jgi:dihydrofolate synthase / folylpolyglutamate synthase
MELIPIRVRPLKAPQDDLFDALSRSNLKLKEGDVVAVSSKVVSIGEGRTVPVEGTDKETLIEQEAEWIICLPNPTYRSRFTINKGSMAGSAGIDQSNGNGHYILYPSDPFTSAKRLRSFLMKTYGVKKLGVLITDSTSIPLRRGAIGFALSWDGFVPLKDYRKKKDLFGREFKIEVANIADGLAAGAVVAMGEGGEGTPVVIIRGAPVTFGNKKTREPLITAPENDLFAPLFFTKRWRRGRTQGS